jgi:hypothetical protein
VSEFEQWQSKLQSDPEAQLDLLRRLVRQKVAHTSFPSGDEHEGKWTRPAVDEFLLDLLETKGPQLVLTVLERATSQGHVERALLVAIEHHLIDQAKTTETGKLRRRLRTVLGEDSSFVHLPEFPETWGLQGRPSQLWQGDPGALLRAAYAVRGYTITTWNTAGPTPGPVKDALRAVTAGVLDWADAAVRAQDLASTLRERFPLLTPLRFSVLEPDALPRSTATPDPADEVAVADVVERVWTSLDPDERAVLPHLHDSPGTWARTVGMRPRQAALVAERVYEKVRLGVPHDDDAPVTLTRLLQRAQGRP